MGLSFMQEANKEMKLVEPRVFKIAHSTLSPDGLMEALKAVAGSDGEAWLRKKLPYFDLHGANWNDGLEATPAELLIETSGRLCYKSFAGEGKLNPNVTKIRQDSKDYFQNILKSGDGSVIEHGSCSFLIVGSRILTHELVRHRIASYSQESLRYVRLTEIPFWLPPWPPTPKNVPERDWELIGGIVKGKIMEAIRKEEEMYQDMAADIPWDSLEMADKKAVTSYLRRMVPGGISTNVIMTANHRIWRWLLEMRTNPAAEVEIRTIFGMIGDILLRDYKLIYQDFKKEALPDGTWQYIPMLRSKV